MRKNTVLMSFLLLATPACLGVPYEAGPEGAEEAMQEGAPTATIVGAPTPTVSGLPPKGARAVATPARAAKKHDHSKRHAGRRKR